MPEAAERIIVALDTSRLEQAIEWVQTLTGAVGAFKVGLEFLHAFGPGGVRAVQAAGADRTFLDGKFSDIPNTVAGAVRAVCPLRPWLLNVHAMCGAAAMRAAREAADTYAHETGNPRPLVIGVTVLTSLDQAALRQIGVGPDAFDLQPLEQQIERAERLAQERGVSRGQEIEELRREFRRLLAQVYGTADPVRDEVVRLAKLARESGLDGVVASPLEIEAVREACGAGFLIVTPGVRPAGAATHDQARVATPRAAVKSGADYLVIGRAITEAADPRAAAREIIAGIG